MSKLWSILNRPIPEMIARWRYGGQALAILYLLAGAYLNYVFVYALVSGKMKIRSRWEWIEGRESLPFGYWIFVAGIGGAALFIDVWFIWILRNALKRPIKSP